MRKMTMMCMAALLLMAVSCKKEKANETYSGEGFRATTESHTGDGDSKTQLLDLSVTWCSGDEIKVFSGSDSRGKEFSAANAGTTADLNPVEGVTDAFFTPPYTAFYPYDSETGINQISLKGTQRYTTFDDGNGNNVLTFASGENPMAAKSSNKVLPFKNLCGILKFQLYSESSASSCTVKSLRVTSLKSGEQLWGTGTVTFDGTNATLGALTGGTGSITLDCSNKDVELGTVDAPTEFMVVIPDGALSEGFTVTLTDSDNNVWSKTTTANNTITKSKIKAMPKQAVTTHTPVSPSEVTVTAGCVSCTYSVGGSVTVPEGEHTCEFGLVYCPTSAGHIPTVADSKIVVNTETFSGSKTFTADLGVLANGVEYKVRAYAMIDGVTYSSESTVKTVTGGDVPQPLPDKWIDEGGKNTHPFTVASGKQVYFSQGNLQYMGSTGTWKFADHQFDFLGNNGQGSTSETADRDLFGWGTSGYHQESDTYNQYYQPWATSTSTVNTSYNYYGYGPSTNVTPGGPSGMTQSAGNISGSYYDWGVNCAISNGVGSSWRTLTKDEWVYLISTRKKGGKLLYGEGMVGNCTPGLIILPDDWSCPTGVTDVSRGASSWSNVYSYSQWAQLEAAGAVFLPAAGYRAGTSVYNVGSNGRYWSSSYGNSYYAYFLYFLSGDVLPSYGLDNRCCGYSVRLVSDDPPVGR